MTNEDILDLDALVPQSQVIKFNSQLLTINPPSVGEILEMGRLGKILTENEANPDYENIIEQIQQVIVKVCPQLENQALTLQQVLALVELIAKMATPAALVETEATAEKKVTSDTPAQ